MNVFLVGGAVRDKLLGFPCHEQDWVVVGATPQELVAQGFKPVGKDFPVFLHPQSQEEYALARTERKTGRGYHGFQVYAEPDVTLEEDLQRRDLTINAIAMDAAGTLFDPYGGQRDIAQKLLRHVSPHFCEDPLRILRVARFAARYHHLGFRVADETLALMQTMVDAGEADHLVPERVWKEISRALAERDPAVFFDVLRTCGALKVLLPELDALFGVPQPAKHHPEIDCGLHSMMVLSQATLLSHSGEVRFAALVHDLGKAKTPSDVLPRHIGHEARSLPLIKQLAKRLGVPNTYTELALLVAQYHTHCHRALELTPKKILEVFIKMDAFRRPERFNDFLISCEADARGRTGFEQRVYPQATYLAEAFVVAQGVTAQSLDLDKFSGKAIGDEINRMRVTVLHEFKRNHPLANATSQ